MLKKLLFTLVVALLYTFSLSAQSGQGSIKGTIEDSETGEPVPFANVQLKNGSDLIMGTTTDFDGKYTLKPIPSGSYDVEVSFVGYQSKRISGVLVGSDKITFQDMEIGKGIQLEEVEIVEYIEPLFEKDNTTVGEVITREELQNMAARTPGEIAKTAGNGTVSKDDGTDDINSRGGRTTNNITIIDGVKVFGATNLPPSAIEEVSVKSGGISAQYGDVTGAVTSITTRGAFKEYFGGIDYLTSGFKVSDDEVIGLDNFGYNAIDMSVGGPIITKKDEKGNVIDSPLGFLLTGQYSHQVNPRPSVVQLYKAKDDVEDLIQSDPFIFQSDPIAPSVNKRAEFLTANDFEKIDFQRNVSSQNIVVNGKIDIKLDKFSSLAVGGTFNRTERNTDVRSYQLYNYENNPLNTTQDIRAYVRYTHRFENAELQDGEEDNSLVKNAFFTLQADFSRRNSTTEDERHGDDFFRYGYVGKFDALTAVSYWDNLGNGVVLGEGANSQEYVGTFLSAFNAPLFYAFTPSDINPILSNYTSSLYRHVNEAPSLFSTRETVEGANGLVNGSTVRGNIYDLWRAPGEAYNSYSKFENDQYRLSGSGSADVGNHAITLGFEYEQRVQSTYILDPTALWQLGRGSVNSHILEIDSTNFSVSQVTGLPQITFERGNTGATSFAYNMRKALGLPVDGIDFIDFDSYDIDSYKIEYFNTDQLINPINNVDLVYRGYDPYGNKTSSVPTLDDFFNEVDDLGQKTRPIAPYQPIYIAGYLEDKFAYEDLIFRLGVRVDRFDANQPVLKDQFSFLPTENAAFVREKNGDLSSEDQIEIPSNIGNDFVVYVSDIDNPEVGNVIGYRDPETNTFYNARGEELSDPSALEVGTGIQPWLKDPSKQNLVDDLDSESFKDYDPQYSVMPRISFSFPISDEATFFANYDILTQRPSQNVALEPIDIIYVTSHSRRLNNPELKPTTTISYELGFKQKLSKSSALTLSSFYREQRDEIQVVRRTGAYPENYLTYSNQDFGTVKGFVVNYDLRRTKNISLRINYTIQFAEGTGSGSLSSLNLVNSGQPNLRTIFPYSYDQRHQITTTLDYRYKSGSKYNGPKISGKNILENSGLNITFLAGSGNPYTARSDADDEETINATNNQPIIGDVNGSRLPWTLRMNARLDKSINLKWGNASDENEKLWKNGKKMSVLKIYLQVLNVLNRENISTVYAYTGNADDDGYLTSALFQDQIRSQLDEQSYRDQYSIRLQNMYNYELPRRIRIGFQLNF
jgi:outer membrane receptor protein involved in Fe transport